MPGQTPFPDLEGIDWNVEPETALNLSTGAVAPCQRVRYRRVGTHAWRSFLLFSDDGRPAPDNVVAHAVAQHNRASARPLR